MNHETLDHNSDKSFSPLQSIMCLPVLKINNRKQSHQAAFMVKL